jgi:cardiolipin synthase (CMP-forming)
MKGLFKGSLTIPNLLTVIRILLIPVFAVLFYNDQLVWAVFVLFLSGLTDFLDGKIARRFNQISELGKILDPIADKLTQITIAVMLFFEFRAAQSESLKAFSWVFLLFLIKEGVMVIGGAIMLSKGIRPGASEILGKVATFVFYGAMLLIIAFGPEVGAFVRNAENSALVLPEWAVMALVIISALLTVAAFASYMPETYRQFKEKSVEKKNQPEKL